MISKRRRFVSAVAVSISVSFLTTLPLKAAERLYFIAGPLNLSLRTESLEEFAKTGHVNQDLSFYFRLTNVNDQQKAAFREALTKRVDLVSPILISRFFNTALGEDLLTRMGHLFQIRGGRNGKYAIRGALIQAALDEEKGLTLMNFLNHLPTNMQLDLQAIQGASNSLDSLSRGTEALAQELATLTEEKSQNQENINFSSLKNLNQPGTYGVAEPQMWRVTDNKRNRTFNVLIYQPQRLRTDKTPVVIISHGLASRPEDFAHWGQHLASYGYVVALPQHIGSDSEQIKALLNGLSREVFSFNEFVDRPLDVSFVIDELERRNNPEFNGKLDLNRVGVMGHSFGGYNMLVLGGATLNFPNLETTCNQARWSPNVALLLQCRALKLPPEKQEINLKDDRVKAILTVNPVAGDIFGAQGLNNLKIPVAFAAGSSDPATPVALEQLRAFIWTGSTEKYFFFVQGQAHINFSNLDGHSRALLDAFDYITLPQQDILDQYANIYTVAFFGRYLLNDPSFADYLTPAFSRYISQPPHEVYLVNQAAENRLSELFNRYRPNNYPLISPPNRN